jgi:hypothetical protein
VNIDALPARFASKIAIDPDTGCWNWTASRDREGYGKYGNGTGSWVRAHRFAYEQIREPIPSGLVIDHLCKNKGCVNPAHLEAVTIWENTLRGNNPLARNARATHCPHGHEYTEQNTGRTRQGWRKCKSCLAAKQRAKQARKRLVVVEHV